MARQLLAQGEGMAGPIALTGDGCVVHLARVSGSTPAGVEVPVAAARDLPQTSFP